MSHLGITPVFGEMYSLYISSERSSDVIREIKAVYIGHKPSITPYYLRLEFPEGHHFAVKSPEGNLEIYVVRSNDRKLKELFFCDGDDEPSYSVGIVASRVDFKMREAERNFLLQMLQRKEDSRKLAA